MHTAQIDHLLFGVPDLQEGIGIIHSLLGESPVPGGKHPGVGTHNALLSLGSSTYLEVIAPDPSQEVLDRDLPYGLSGLVEPGLITWAVRPGDMSAHIQQTEALGMETRIKNGSRMKPDGKLLKWRSALPNPPLEIDGQEFTGLIPFAIEWQSAQHPANSTPGELKLDSLQLIHPCLNLLSKLIGSLALPCSAEEGDMAGIKARIEVEPNRFVTLT